MANQINLEILEKKLEICFKNKTILKEALIHRSYLNEHPDVKIPSNERLEFLGDAILEFIISKILFEKFPKETEGFLTAFRSKIVQTETLYQIAKNLSLGEFLFLSKGEEKEKGRENRGILENALEALIGAIFLDQGMEKTEAFIKKHFLPIILNTKPSDLRDPKSLFQEIVQEKEKITPRYKIISEEGPDHAKIFTVGVYIRGEKIADGKGPSKQKAEEKAATLALKKYQKEE